MHKKKKSHIKSVKDDDEFINQKKKRKLKRDPFDTSSEDTDKKISDEFINKKNKRKLKRDPFETSSEETDKEINEKKIRKK